MPHEVAKTTSKRNLTTNDLRSIAVGLAAAVAIVMLASAMTSDSGSVSAAALDEEQGKAFAPPFAVTTPTTSATEDVAYSSTVQWIDPDGDSITLTCPSCLSWMSFSDNGDNTATITGTPTDAHVDAGGTAITVQGVANGDTVQQSYTVTVTEVNDEPTLTATGVTDTFTEGGSNLVLFSSAAAGDSDSQTTQTFLEFVLTVTNVQDDNEFLVIDGSDCDITASATCVANTAGGSSMAVAVVLTGTTATVTVTADAGGIAEATLESMIDAIAYKNTDASPTTGQTRVVTITTLQDNGGTANSGDDSVSVTIAATVTVANTNNAPTITDTADTGAVTEASAGTTDTATDTMVGADGDGDTITWGCSSCSSSGGTSTITGTYGSFSIVESSGAWTYTLDNSDAQTDALDGGDQVTETITVTATANGQSASHDVVITVNGANDLPTSSAGSASTTEDTLLTFANSDFSFTDVDGDDTSFSRIQITTVESTGDLECQNANGDADGWQDCVANDYVTAGTSLRLTPAANSDADITFSFKVHDGTAYSASSYVMTVDVSAANDAPTFSATANDLTVNEDTAGTITGTTVADVDHSSLTMTVASTQSATFSLATTSGLTFSAGDGTSDNSMTFTGTTADINTAIATVTWTSQLNNNNNAAVSFTVSDTVAGDVVDTVTVTVNAVQDLPTAADFTVTVNEDNSHVFAASEFGYADVDSDAMASATLQAASAGTLWLDNGAGAGTADDGEMTGDEAAVSNGDTITTANLAKLTWAPAANANGATYATFTFTVNDGTGNSASSYTATLAVTAVNDAPANAGDTATVTEDVAYNGWTAATDWGYSDVDGDTMASVLIIGCPATGTLTIGGNACQAGSSTATLANLNTISYTTASNADTGNPTFTYQVNDGTTTSATGTMTITITAVNDAPGNAGDTATVNEDTAYVAWTASSDWGYSDVDTGDAMTAIKLMSLPSQGTLTDDDEEACAAQGTADCEVGDVILLAKLDDLFYTGSSNYNGADTFTYQVYDGEAYSSTGTMTMTVSPVNDAPVAGNTLDQTVYEDVAFSFQTVASTDVDGDTLTHVCVETGGDMPAFLSETADTGGRATLGGTPTAAALTLADSGNDNTYGMTCTVSDPSGGTATDTFVITVTAVNDAPYLSSDGSGAADAGSVTEDDALSITLTSTDEEAADVTFSKTSGGSCPSWITLTDAGGGASTATLTALASEITDARVGDHTCDITMTDGTSNTLDTYTLTISQENDEPTLSITTSTPAYTENDGNTDLFSSVTVGDGDAQADQTIASVVVTITNVADTTEYFVVDSTDISLTNGASGTTTGGSSVGYTVSIADGTATVTLTTGTMTLANTGSMIDAFAYRNTDDTPTAGNRVITITSIVDSGSNAGDNDNVAAPNSASTLAVSAVDDAPCIADWSATFNEDTAYTLSTALFQYTDAEGDALTHIRYMVNAAWNTAVGGTLWDDANGNGEVDGGETTYTYGNEIAVGLFDADRIKYLPASNVNGASYEKLDWQAKNANSYSDSTCAGLDSGRAQTTLTITAVNDAPTTSGGSASPNEDATHTFTTTASDWGFGDVDSGDAMTTVDITSLPATGTLMYSGNAVNAGDDIAIGNLGGLTYVPVTNANGDVTFTFKVNDGDAWSAAAGTFTLSYQAVNDAPVNTLGTPNAVNEDTANAITGNSIADVDDTSMTSVAITANRGTFSLAQTTGLNFAAGDGTSDATMTFGGTVANINLAIATITWTSAADDDADATITVVTTDDEGGSDTDSMTITVNSVNDAPANAGDTAAPSEDVAYSSWTAATDWGYSDVDSDTLVSVTLKSLPSQGTLTCAGSNCAVDDVILLANLNTLVYTGASNYNGADSFTYTLQDAALSSATGTMSLSVAAVDDAPVCDAGDAQSVAEGATVTLDGTGSSDVESDTITYAWTVSAGTTQTVSNANTAAPSFTASDQIAGYTTTLQLVCTANGQDGAADTVVITVSADNDAPTASAGSDQTPAEGATVTLDASGSSDPEGTSLSYTWSQTSGTSMSLSSTSVAQPTFTAPQALTSYTLVFEVSVTDGVNSAVTDSVTITVSADNDAPTASAGADQTPAEGATVTLDASGSSDPEGTSLSYTWSQTSGTSMSLSSTSVAQPTFTAPQALTSYTLVFEVSVTDGVNSAVTDSVTITVSADNDAPTASAGSDQTVAEGATVTLDASGSSDPEGGSVSYTWSQTAGTTMSLSSTSVAQPTFTALQALANYQVTFQVSVSDSNSASTDSVTITVTADNDAPTASAGSDQTPAEGATVTLDASGSSDPEGTSLSYTWSQTSGTSMSLSSTSVAQPTFTAPEATANYALVFQVSVTDGVNSAVTDSVTITVSADNDAPSFTSNAVTSVNEDAAYTYDIATSDPEGQTVTVSCTTCPSWLSMNNGDLTGTPDNDDVGNNAVTLSATDGTTAVTQSFTVVVSNVNTMGAVSLSGTTTEDQTLTATVSDPDGLSGVTITYQWQSTATPGTASSWSDINGATAATYDLTQSEVGKYVRISVQYTDAQGGVESHTGMMGTVVANVNDANTGTPTLSGTQAEDETLTVDASPLTGNDEDGMTGSSYTYQWQRCTSNSASSCSDVSGSTSTTYLLGQADTDKFIRAGVSYVDDYSTTETVYSAFTSQIGNINDAPNAGSDQTGALTEDASTSTVSNTVGASDPDTGDVLSYSASSSTGTYGTFAVTSQGVWTYTLDNNDADTTALDANDQVTDAFTITVSDDATPSLSDTMTVTITITGANDAPSAGSDQTGSVTEDASTATATGSVAGTDADDSASLTYTPNTNSGTYGSIAFSGASWTYTLDNSDADTTALDANDQVTDTFTVTVSDSVASDTMDIVITVTGANDAPSAGSDQTGSVVEDASTSTVTGTVSGTDADDSASLTYTASNSGSGTYGSIAFSGASWTYTLDNSDADTTALAAGASASDAFTITVSDGTASDTMSITIGITGANDAPSFNTAGVTSATEDTAYSYTASATDVDTGDSATVAVVSSTCPSWATCSGASISGTPGNSDIGSYAVDITATDQASATTTQSFTIVVAPTNDAPTIDSTAVTSATEDAVYTYTLVGSDVDGDTITMDAPTLPGWLTFTASTGVLTGTPLNANVGTSGNDVVLSVTDGQVTVTQSFTITVANTNDAPTIDSNAVTAVDEDSTYTYTVTGADVDVGDTLTLNGTTVPTWLTFTESTGVLTGTPTNDEVGSHSVTITVTDAAGLSAAQTFTIVVANTNDAPTIDSTAVTAVDEDSSYLYTVTASDVDVGDTTALSATIGSSSAWLTFEPSTGKLTGTPANGDVGTHSITVTATDDSGDTGSQTFTITVANTNDAPTISSNAVTSVDEDSTYTYTVTGEDVDSGDTITLNGTSVPTWLTFTESTGVLTGTPTNDEVGSHSVTITVTDAAGDTGSQTFSITVVNTNDAPSITSTAGTAVDEDALYSYSITTSDVDVGDSMAISFVCATCDDGTGTNFLSMTDNGNGTATLSGTPVNEDVGSHSVTVTATDGAGEADTETFTIVVTDTNDAPTITSTHVITATEDALYTYTVTAEDPDGNAQAVYSYNTTTNPDWLVFVDNNNGTATLTGTPDNSDVGDHTVAFSVSDGTATDTATFTITVANTQDASTGSISITGDAYEGLTLTVDTSGVSDDDGVGTFTYQWSDADGAITGATSSTYTIPACNPTTACASIGKVYSVTAVHTDAYGFVEALSLSDGPTSAVVINPTGDLDSDGISNDVDSDIDGDGYTNAADSFDYDGTEWYDTDSDGTGNNADTDDDNDGICDTVAFDNVATGITNSGSVVPCYNGPDDFPLDSSEQFDADGDGWGHNADVDDDGDGILDAVDTDRDGDGDPDATDQFPDNHNEWDDTDTDGIGNNGDTDDDGDGTLDVNDAFPLDNTEDTDTDADGIGNNADTDDDGDGYSDADETANCGTASDPLDATSTPLDTDGDLTCNELDADDDGDGYADASDAFPLDSTEWVDYDGDGTGDNADADDDNDGVDDATDAFDNDVDAWTDTDGDGLADDFPNYPIVTTTTLCDIVNTAGSATCTFTVPAGITATATMTATDFYAGEGTMTVGGSSYTQASSYGSGQTVSATLTEGSYTLTITDTWSDGGQSATVSYSVTTPTPSVSAAGTALDMDDDGDNVLDVNENAGCSLLADCDGDGDNDDTDQFPLNSAEWDDTDGDAPAGSDGTGYGDNSDAFPTDACANVDTDGDGQPDTIVSGCTTTLTEDVDDDNDGVGDAFDDFPLDSAETTDTDNDGTGDNADTDDDGDGYADVDDIAPLDSAEWWDTDGDGIYDTADSDDDGDGTPDVTDTYPIDADNDGWDDRYEDACGTDKNSLSSVPSDYDGDTVKYVMDGTTGLFTAALNTGAVNMCDSIDTDDDNDGYLDTNDAFDFDPEVWVDTDGDGLADFIDPNSTVVAYAVSQSDICNMGTSYATGAGSCTMTVPTGGYVDMSVSFPYSSSWSTVSLADPTGASSTIATFLGSGADISMTLSVAGDWVISWTDDPGYPVIYVVADSYVVSGTTVPSITSAGTSVDSDDDGDGYSDLDEGDAYDTATAALCNDGSAYASSSNSLDSTSTPADMDGDYTCDALDSDRDGDSYSNTVDVFPDDSTEWADYDADGTGDNADTDDDADGTLDVNDAFPYDICADTDTDSDGQPDTMTAGCTSTLVLDSDDDGDSVVDADDAFPLDSTESIDTDGDGTGNNADTDDDGDGVIDTTDVWPLNACASSDFDGDGSPDTLVAGCMPAVASIGFEAASTGTIYTDTGNESLNHTLVNNAGESAVSYSSSSRNVCQTVGSTGAFGYVSGDFECSFTVNAGESLTVNTYSYYSIVLGAVTLTGPSGHLLMSADAFDSGSGFTGTYGPFYEAGTYTYNQSNIANYASLSGMAFSATVTGSDVDYGAAYTTTGGTGLTDGDYVGVTSYATTVGAFTEGTQGYQMSDTDGILTLTTGTVSDVDSVSMDLFVQSTSWETSDYITVSFVGTTTTVLLDTNGYDIDLDFPTYEGVWTSVSGAVSGTGYLVVEFSSNAATESIYLDNIMFYSDGLDLDLDDDNDGYLDVNDDCPFDATENLDTDGDGFCNVQDTDDDGDGVYDWNDLYPLDPTESADADGDGIGDNADTDDDNDGTPDVSDAFPFDPSEDSDVDGDLVGDNADTDDDNDGVSDDMDVWPLDGTQSTDTDGDGIADFLNTITNGESFDFETGGIPSNITTAFAFSQCTGGQGSNPAAPAACIPSTTHNDWSVTSTTPIAGTYSLMSGQASSTYAEVTASVSFYTTGGDMSWDWKVSSVERTYTTGWTDGLKVYVNGVQIDASQYGGCVNGEWCGENTGSMTWNLPIGNHTVDFTFDFGTGGSGGSSTAWIDNLALPSVMTSSNYDLDDDNDGANDSIDLDSLDPCIGLDSDGDGLSDALGVMFDGTACDASLYNIDDDDDNDGWTDAEELACGTDTLDPTSLSPDNDADGLCDGMDDDDDNDGVLDVNDAFPMDPSEFSDNDGDGTGDNNDTDDDNDGVTDGLDAFPLDSSETSDYDGDGIGDNADTDDDGDGCDDASDAFPYNINECVDTDGDGLGDNVDPDDDGDGVADVADPFPMDPSESADDDGDGIGNNADTDDDGDGVDDVDDAFPMDPSESADLDGDGLGDNSDADDDGDGVNDGIDAFPADPSETADLDGDGIGDNTDTDDDGDGVDDTDDAFPYNPGESADFDGDGIGDNGDNDDDGDGYADADDWAPMDANEWLDTDGDGTGDNADDNDDGDDYTDAYEISCGTDSLDADSVPSDFDGDDLCDALDDVDDSAGEGDTETELGWTNAVPGFPALLAAIALVGAALVGRKKED